MCNILLCSFFRNITCSRSEKIFSWICAQNSCLSWCIVYCIHK